MKTIIQISLILAVLCAVGCTSEGVSKAGKAPGKFSSGETEQDPRFVERASAEWLQITVDLLKRGGDPNKLVHELSWSGQTEALRLLEIQGFNANFKKDGMAPLHFAVHKEHFETALFLIEKGADVNLKTGFQKIIQTNVEQTALHFAAFSGDTKMINLLLSKGADVNSLSPLLGMPLDVAIDRNQINAVSILRKHGAITSQQNLKAAAQAARDFLNKVKD